MITGAAGGLGKAFAAECASRGWRLFLTDISDKTLLPLAQGMERMYDVDVLCYPCDLTDPSSRDALWKHMAAMGLRFHFLINVAGTDFEGPFAERQVEQLRTIVRLNVESTLENTRRILPLRDRTRVLRIVTVSSLAGYYPMPVKATYAASKRFLLDFSIALREELDPSEATVTALCPAGMPTNRDCIRSIEGQGIMGRLTTTNVGDVAAQTIDHALAGRSVVIPGALNQALRLLGGMVPAGTVARMIAARWTKVRRKTAQPTLAPVLADLQVR
jgi:short-subunit dehydrogenase